MKLDTKVTGVKTGDVVKRKMKLKVARVLYERKHWQRYTTTRSRGKGSGKTQAVGTRCRLADSRGKRRQSRWLEGTCTEYPRLL